MLEQVKIDFNEKIIDFGEVKIKCKENNIREKFIGDLQKNDIQFFGYNDKKYLSIPDFTYNEFGFFNCYVNFDSSKQLVIMLEPAYCKNPWEVCRRTIRSLATDKDKLVSLKELYSYEENDVVLYADNLNRRPVVNISIILEKEGDR